MSVKYYCDACGKEIVDRKYKFNYLCHIADKNTICGYVDIKTMQPVSGREEIKDVCLTCYNKIYFGAFEIFEEINKNKDIH